MSAELTPREIMIVRSVAQGRRNKEIAFDLGLTENTVKVYCHRIYEKLGVGRVGISLFVYQSGLAEGSGSAFRIVRSLIESASFTAEESRELRDLLSERCEP